MIRFARKFALAVGKDFRFPLADFLLEERVVQLDQPAVMFTQNSVYRQEASPLAPLFTGNPNFSIRWLASSVCASFPNHDRCLRLCDVPDVGRSRLTLSLLATGEG